MKSFCLVLFSILLLSSSAESQQPPYDVYPDANPPYYRVRYDASKDPGRLIFPVNYTVWIPQGVVQLRGVIVHQHGCGEGSCKSGLTGAYDLHWQALARKHDCALLAPSYEQPQKADCQMWCDPRNGSDKSFLTALEDLGEQCGHPELAKVPWALWGHSGGGHWCGGMALLYPDRVAATWLRSGVPLFEANPERPLIKPHKLSKAALQVPMMCNPGTKEGVSVKDGRFAKVWPANVKFFEQVRGAGGVLGVAVDPLTAHECGNQRYLAIRWFDACLALRLPNDITKPLRRMPESNVCLAELLGDTAVIASEFEGDPLKAVWLPNESVAKLWMEYVKDTTVSDMTAPPAPKRLTLAENRLTWTAIADLQSGLSHFEILRDGKLLASVPKAPKNRYGRPLFQDLQYSDTPAQPLAKMEFDLSEEEKNQPYRYQVVAVNTLGNKSKPSSALTVNAAKRPVDKE